MSCHYWPVRAKRATPYFWGAKPKRNGPLRGIYEALNAPGEWLMNEQSVHCLGRAELLANWGYSLDQRALFTGRAWPPCPDQADAENDFEGL